MPPFDFYDAARPVFTHPRFLPASKVERCTIAERADLRGLHHARRRDRARHHRHPQPHRRAACSIRNSLILGADFYETLEEMEAASTAGMPAVGIGDDAVIENAIIDKNARIGRSVRIINEAGVKEKDGDGYYIREGIVIVPKNGVIPDGTVI